MNFIHTTGLKAMSIDASVLHCPNGDVTLGYRRFGLSSGGKTPVLFVHGLSYF
jgi:hypothetical protein